jgi:hypothetical protein
MREIKIRYNSISPRRQEWRGRLQLIAASVGIIAGYSESLSIYTSVAIILPIIGFFIAFLNILFARFYSYFMKKYGNKFELLLIRANGIVMLITGIGFHISGSKYIQYAYYILTIMFLIIFPIFILSAKNKRMILTFTQSEFIIQKRLRPIKNAWQNIDLIGIQNNVLSLKIHDQNKIKKYFIEPDDKRQTEIMDYIEKLKAENDYKYKSQPIAESTNLHRAQ